MASASGRTRNSGRLPAQIVIPAKSGNPFESGLVDSGSALRYGRNDDPATARASSSACRAFSRCCEVSGFTDRRRHAEFRALAACDRNRSPRGMGALPGKRWSRSISRPAGLPACETHASDRLSPQERLQCRNRNRRAHHLAPASQTGPNARCDPRRSRREMYGCAAKSGRRMVRQTSNVFRMTAALP